MGISISPFHRSVQKARLNAGVRWLRVRQSALTCIFFQRKEILQMTESSAIKVGQLSIRYLLDGARTGTTRTFDQQP